MSIFISSQDYLTMSSECEQIELSIVNHRYKFWCKKDNAKQANIIIKQISPIIEKTANQNPALSFDKVLLLSIIDILAQKQEYNTDLQNKCKETTSQYLIDNFIEILTQIQCALNENRTSNP